MQPNEQYIHELITGKLAGVISREEELYLEKLKAENAEVKAQCEQIERMYAQEDIKSRLENKELVDIAVLLNQRRRRRVHKITWYAGLVAASVTGIILFNYFFISKNTEPPTLADKTEKRIELKLANGTVLNLSHSGDSIQAGNALLNNTNKTLSYTTGNAGNVNAVSSLNSLTVPPGMDYQVVLSDGSEVWLNSATTLQFPFTFTGNTREIIVSGEAYLKIAPLSPKGGQGKIPFIVHLAPSNSPGGGESAGATIQVLGTEFNVNSYDSGMLKCALVEGAVRFKAAGEEIAIKPGTEAMYAENKGITTQPFDEDEVLGWRHGRYYFYETTLQEIATGLPRWMGIDAVIDDAAIRQKRFTGILNRNKPVTAFLGNLKKTMKIDYYISQDGVLHFK